MIYRQEKIIKNVEDASVTWKQNSLMTSLITTDLHLTDKPRDEYRFGLFPWIRKKVEKYNLQRVFILGDLTDFKDRHSSTLVNRIVDELGELSEEVNIDILEGNHDFVDVYNPFFRFLNGTKGIRFFYGKPTPNTMPDDSKALMLPFTKTPKKDWKKYDLTDYDYIFMHQTFGGAIASNGYKMEGLSASLLKGVSGQVFSGDIHVPQKIGKVTYVGSPYHIHFGDTFQPRIILLEEGRHKYLHFPCLKKVTLNIKAAKDLYNITSLSEGDQVKVRISIQREQFVDWDAIKQDVQKACDKLGLDVFGIEPREKKTRATLDENASSSKPKIKSILSAPPNKIIHTFCKREKVGEYIQNIGVKLLDT